MLTEIQREAGEQLGEQHTHTTGCVCVCVCWYVGMSVCVCVCVLGLKHVSRELKCADCVAVPTAVKRLV